MILIIGAWYNEVGYSFDFSYKVDNFIREQIKKIIFPKYNLDKLELDFYLNLVISTDSTIKDVEVRGPGRRKKAKMIDFGLYLPYKEIYNSNYPLEKYLDYLFESLIIVFRNYDVESNDILLIKEYCKNEILNNIKFSINDSE